jgi:ElaB/YqjD/DUF883 family membrane-anchored ribosome-binding protein
MAKKDNQTATSQSTSETQSSGSNNRAADAYRSARERTTTAFSSTREKAGSYTQRASSGISTNPAGALVGAFAVGALVGALLPRSERETQLLGSAGRKLTDAARSAASTAVENSRDKIDQATGSVVNKLGAAVLETVNHTS